jgi:acyl-CoA thioester hydrolase
MAHRIDVRVYYSDTDAGGIVYHGRYLDFAEHARTELLRRATADDCVHQNMLSKRIGYVVKSLSVEYHAPAYLDDLLTVETTIESAKRFSLTFLQRVLRGDDEIATLHVRVAAIDLQTMRIQPIDPGFSTVVAAL